MRIKKDIGIPERDSWIIGKVIERIARVRTRVGLGIMVMVDGLHCLFAW